MIHVIYKTESNLETNRRLIVFFLDTGSCLVEVILPLNDQTDYPFGNSKIDTSITEIGQLRHLKAEPGEEEINMPGR